MNATATMTVESAPITVVPRISNEKHKLFADAVLAGKSNTQAAIDAGYAERSAGSFGYKLIKHKEIADYIEHHKAQATENAVSLQERVISELTDMAFFNLHDVASIDDDGHLQIDFTNASSTHYKAVTKVKTKTRSIRDSRGNVIATEKEAEIGLADKYRGLELLGKHLGMFKEAEQRVVVDVADRLLSARQRVIGMRRVGESEGDGDG